MLFGSLFEVVEGFVKVALYVLNLFTVRFGIGLGLVRDLSRVDLWFIEDWFKV